MCLQAVLVIRWLGGSRHQGIVWPYSSTDCSLYCRAFGQGDSARASERKNYLTSCEAILQA